MPKAGDQSTDDLAKLRSEIESLRSENKELKGGEGQAKDAPTGRWRQPLAITLLVISALVASFAVAAVWFNQQVVDTDAYVNTVAPVADEPAIQAAVADFATEQLFENADVESRVGEALPPEASILVGPITGSLEDLTRSEATKLLASDQFKDIWVTANRSAHELTVGVLKGESDALTVEDNAVTLNFNDLINQIKERLSASGVTVFDQIDVDVPGEFTILESSALGEAQTALSTLDNLALWLPIAALALFGAAIWISTARRKAVIWVGLALAIGMVILRLGIDSGRSLFLDGVADTEVPADAATALFDVLIQSLLVAGRSVFALGLVIIAAAILAGPSHFAVTLRERLGGGIQELGAGLELGAFGEWVAERKAQLRWAGVAVGMVILISVDQITAGTVAWIAAGLAIYIGLIELLGQPEGEKAPGPEEAKRLSEEPKDISPDQKRKAG